MYRIKGIQHSNDTSMPTRLYFVSGQDINPATGKAYAINPSSGNWDDNYFAQNFGGEYQRQHGGRQYGEDDYSFFNRQQQEQAKQIIEPAVKSLEAGIPELKQAYQTRQTELAAEKDPLIQRYEQLLNEIRGRETSQVNDVTKTTNREMGRRGITLDSTFAAEETQGRTAPIHGAAESDILSTTFDREAKLRDIDNSITNLTSEMVAAERDVRNSIAQIQAQSGQQAAQNAINLYNIATQQRQAELDRLLKEKELANNTGINQQNANTSAIKEVQGGLYNTQTGQWLVQPKATGTTSNVLNLGTQTQTQGVNGNQFLVSSGNQSNSKQGVQLNLGSGGLISGLSGQQGNFTYTTTPAKPASTPNPILKFSTLKL